ncbi:hypothetical protein C2845_PM03G07110 [Panicum miliaceum]|uniref:DUF4220 domain-containing protein n=1 Tax=Panicum miliaceum TaxID=4540 RepID=A0A3L6T711_PANMI|nr:hypothetical protein C2845_PM03G07110 [Panicum miliaceum]
MVLRNRMEAPAGEHRVLQMAAASDDGAGQGKVVVVGTPEKPLNCFVRSVAVIERVGNALATLAFTWATVVLLGGYPTVLSPADDFWFATTIVFLEAARMFSRNNKVDYRLFFHTRGALRPLGWNGLVIIVFLSDILNYLLVMIRQKHLPIPLGLYYLIIVSMLILTAAISQLLSSGALKLVLAKTPLLHRAASLCAPLLAVLLLAPSVRRDRFNYANNRLTAKVTMRNTMARWTGFHLLFLAVLLLTISRLRFQRITRLVDRALGSKQVFWRRLMLNMCMVAALVMTATVHEHQYYRNTVTTYQSSAVVVVSFGNLQIPAAAIRIVLSLLRLIRHDYGDEGDPNNPARTKLAPSLNIFYVMVLGQGILYVIACMLEIFSCIPRRSLIRRGGFRGQWAVESIDLYCSYALEKCMERDVLAPNKTSL